MESSIRSIRPFIGAANHEISSTFYRAWGWQELPLPHKMSFFRQGDFGFYLQDYFVEDWVSNTMLFLEVEDLPKYRDHLLTLNLTDQFPGVRIKADIVENDWGREFFVHDPSNVLWHIGEFYR